MSGGDTVKNDRLRGAGDRWVPTVLSRWDEGARGLPWRTTRDPWLVLVSEIMSQQTQVDRVIPKWTAFVERFPTPADAANAKAGELISMWDGLGYNRRALMLHACAIEIEEQHDGALPDSLDALLALPGVGPYTARAVLAFAFERDVGVLDTNVGRVLARLSGEPLEQKKAQALADSLVPSGEGWRWNQAILDFGAQVCQKRTPKCSGCPIQAHCSWHGEGADPAVGSAAVSAPQSTFAGSDRQGRGKLVAQVRCGPVDIAAAGDVMGFSDDPERSERVLDSLEADGLIVRVNGRLVLP